MNSLLVLLACALQPISIQVEGDGYLRFSREGRVVYAKSATLVAKEGRLADSLGDPVMPTLVLPSAATAISVDAEGSVFAKLPSGDSRIGRLVLAVFPASASLVSVDGKLVCAERPKLCNPGDPAGGKIRVSIPTTSGSSAIAVKPNPEATAGALRLGFYASVELSSEHVLLSDLCQCLGAPDLVAKAGQIQFGSVPMLGVKRTIDHSVILARLKSAGIAVSTESPSTGSITVMRKGQTIPHSQFVEIAATALATSPEITAKYESRQNQPDYVAPLGELKLVVEKVSGVNAQTASVQIGIFVGGKRINSRTVKFDAQEPDYQVKTGQTIKVIFKAGGTAVEATGIAKGSAPLGGTLQVEVAAGTNKTKTIHTGTVTAPGVVEVKL